jgi:hypothetical protein
LNLQNRVVGFLNLVPIDADQLPVSVAPRLNQFEFRKESDRRIDGLCTVPCDSSELSDSELVVWIPIEKFYEVVHRLISENSLFGERDGKVDPRPILVNNTDLGQ